MVSLGLADLADVSADEAAAFNGMNTPSVANPIATQNDVTGAVAPLEAEISAARGAAASVDERLDASLDESGAIKQTAGAFPEVIQARGSQPTLDARLDVSLDETGAIRQTAGAFPEVIQARGTQPSLDARLDASLNEDGSLKPLALADLSDVSADQSAAFGAMDTPSAARHVLVGADDVQGALDGAASPSASNPLATYADTVRQAQVTGTVAADAVLTLNHNFGVLPNVTVLKQVAGDWVDGLASASLVRVDASIARIQNLASTAVDYAIVATV
jgi:hypothetical protein